MNKNRLILAVIGGVIAVAVLVAAFLVWQAYSAKVAAREGDEEEGTEGLEAVVNRAQTLSRKPIYPCAESVKALKTGRETISEWRAEALRFVARGDRPIEKTTPAAFKTFIVADARRIAMLKGAVKGALVKPDFTFGPFKDYIAEGKMPPEAQLTEIQRRWDDVTTVAETLSACGVDELTDVAFRDDAAAKEAAEREAAQKKKGPKKGQKNGAKNESSVSPLAYGYTFSFLARPAALIKVVNALTTCERFVVIDSITFDRTRDVIAEALGGDEKKNAEAQQQSGRRRRRGGRGGDDAAIALAAGAETAAEKNGIVTDPAVDAPFAAKLSVTVYDFRTLASDAEAKDDEKKGKEAAR